MDAVRKLVGIAGLVVGIAYGLLLLNTALFRFWAGGGPPNENPAWWLFTAWSHLAWSGASVLAGLGVFLLLGRPSRGWGSALALTLAGFLSVLPYAREFLAQDSCLDHGGSWSSAELRCIKGAG